MLAQWLSVQNSAADNTKGRSNGAVRQDKILFSQSIHRQRGK